jgi:hypothetical protein
MIKMFKENGFLSEEGKKVLQPLHDGLTEVMSSVEVRNLSLQELQTLQANLAKLVGDAVSDKIYVTNYQGTKTETLPGCTGHWWRDEYGSEAFVHDEFTYCPVHDSKTAVKV